MIIDVPAAKPTGGGSYVKGRSRYRVTHCTEAIARTTVTPKAWQASWDDIFTNYQAWEQAGKPSGYVWGVEYADAYPGMTHVTESDRARHWTELLGHNLHEVRIQSNVLVLELVFHDLRVTQLAAGDPDCGTLSRLATRPTQPNRRRQRVGNSDDRNWRMPTIINKPASANRLELGVLRGRQAGAVGVRGV